MSKSPIRKPAAIVPKRVHISTGAVRRIFDPSHTSKGKKATAISFARAVLRNHPILDKWFTLRSFQWKDRNRFEEYNEAINQLILAIDFVELQAHKELAISLDDKHTLHIEISKNKLIISLRKKQLFGTSKTQLYSENIPRDNLENTIFFQQCSTASSNYFATGHAASWMEENVATSLRAFQAREETRKTPNPLTIFLTNHGSGRKQEEAAQYNVALPAVHSRAAAHSQRESRQLDGPDIVTAKNFDENVTESTLFLLKTTLAEVNRIRGDPDAPRVINFRLCGYSRGASISVVAYNFLQHYLKAEYTQIPPELKRELDEYVWNKNVNRDRLQEEITGTVANPGISLQTDLLLLDPVRGHYSGKYGKWATYITKPLGHASTTYCEVVASTRKNYGGTVDSILDLSHISLDHSTTDNLGRIHARLHVVDSDHSDIDKHPQANGAPGIAASPITRSFLPTTTAATDNAAPTLKRPASTPVASNTTKRTIFAQYARSNKFPAERCNVSRLNQARLLMNMSTSIAIEHLKNMSLIDAHILLQYIFNSSPEKLITIILAMDEALVAQILNTKKAFMSKQTDAMLAKIRTTDLDKHNRIRANLQKIETEESHAPLQDHAALGAISPHQTRQPSAAAAGAYCTPLRPAAAAAATSYSRETSLTRPRGFNPDNDESQYESLLVVLSPAAITGSA